MFRSDVAGAMPTRRRTDQIQPGAPSKGAAQKRATSWRELERPLDEKKVIQGFGVRTN
jgi:hypothetical protein